MKKLLIFVALVFVVAGIAGVALRREKPTFFAGASGNKRPRSAIVGVWGSVNHKYPAKYYYRFLPNGAVEYWDTDSSSMRDGEFKKWPAKYKWEDGRIHVWRPGIPPQTVGILEVVSNDQLKQDSIGYGARYHLIYKRESSTSSRLDVK